MHVHASRLCRLLFYLFFFFWFALQHEKEDLFKTEVLSILVRFKTLSFHSLLIVLNREALHFRTDASGGLRFSFYHCLEISGKAAFFFFSCQTCVARREMVKLALTSVSRCDTSLKVLASFISFFPSYSWGFYWALTVAVSFFFFSVRFYHSWRRGTASIKQSHFHREVKEKQRCLMCSLRKANGAQFENLTCWAAPLFFSFFLSLFFFFPYIALVHFLPILLLLLFRIMFGSDNCFQICK